MIANGGCKSTPCLCLDFPAVDALTDFPIKRRNVFQIGRQQSEGLVPLKNCRAMRKPVRNDDFILAQNPTSE